MLSHIHIRDFAIVDQLDLEFDDKLSALTGETGAGKSILLDALGLCLGDRADSDTIRPGADRAELTVSFELDESNPALAWLDEHELREDNDCILRRIIQAGGRSKSYINGRPAPLQALRELGEQLVDIHGQHAHQSLLRKEMQRQLLDDFGGHQELLRQAAALYSEYRDLQREIEQLEGGQQDYESRLELLRYQVNELEALGLEAEDIEALDAEHRKLSSAGDLLTTCQALLTTLYDDDGSAQSALSHAAGELERMRSIDPALGDAHEMFNNALIQLEEGCDNLRRYADSVDLDPGRLEWIEERLGSLNDLARKHRLRPEELPARLEALREELAHLEGAEERLTALRQRQANIMSEYRQVASQLTEARRQAATLLDQSVTGFIKELGMPGGELRIEVEPQDTNAPSRFGADHVLFTVRTNPGQSFGPVHRVASGGELSRIGLAIQVATVNTAKIPTLVFDEADTGMGGAVAEVVGRKLQQLGRTHQVLCITHLPQVAAQAEHHYRVKKESDGETTRTTVIRLDNNERVEEIARMLGGVEITENTLNHAREMLEKAREAAQEATSA
ncbi:DNA repair protein RecN [Alkalilimnicola ehrlichii]|uniref:DNA repair protein RecN n=1 Tax=Alkalilimnicola ehrlichii TaxID=351052 RepID=A0A3E0WS75_9GAMM|nr:DNA repair protein RecN [Alkalilimnicola ehrlichii]RFA28234.1 DNA repair protein RecN [Alkalilimnicola ehrlichii]RFA34835.1 DNA repair protein RecN [Alkalilimnicola ehrlichii]